MDQWEHSAHHQAVLQNLSNQTDRQIENCKNVGPRTPTCHASKTLPCPHGNRKAGFPSHKPKAKAAPACPSHIALAFPPCSRGSLLPITVLTHLECSCAS